MRDFRFGTKVVFIERAFAVLRAWLEALSPAAVAVVVSNAPVPGALWGTLAGGGAGSLYRPWALPVATVVTALAMRAWGWPVALALSANWFSWAGGMRARALAAASWALLGWYGAGRRWEVSVLCGVGLSANLIAGALVLLRRRRMQRRLSVIGMMILFFFLPGVVLAEGPEPGDVIFHEGFEGFRDFDQRVADGWQTWSAPDGHTPEYKQANPEVAPYTRAYPDRVHAGDNAQQYFTVYRVHDAGLYRQISAPPFAVVEVSAWAETWTSNDDDPGHSDPAQNVNVRVGVDPAGGVNAQMPTVLWGEAINPLSVWQAVPPVRAQVGESGVLTIFLRSSPMYELKHNDVYWDDVQVKLIEPGRAPPATAAPAGGGSAAAAPPADPILGGLTAAGTAQQAAGAGGWDSLLPPFLVAGVVILSLFGRKRR